jgi:hypothetical protein
MAGKGGIGDGDLPVRPWNADAEVLSAGDPAACEPENEERREPGLVAGGSICWGVEDAEGVMGVARCLPSG